MVLVNCQEQSTLRIEMPYGRLIDGWLTYEVAVKREMHEVLPLTNMDSMSYNKQTGAEVHDA